MAQALILTETELGQIIEPIVTKAVAAALSGQVNLSTAAMTASDLLTLQQACKYLHISKPTFIALRKRGAFKAHPIGNRHLFSKAELEGYVKSKTAA